MTSATHNKAKPGLWAGLFASNMAVIAVLFVTGAIEPPTPYILMVLNAVLLVPVIRTGKRLQAERGAMTRAVARYNRRFLSFAAIYSVAMMGSALAADRMEWTPPAMWLLAVVPMIPAFGMIWAIMQYLREETDEYLRHRAVNSAVVGLGFVLVLGTGWGFLETFGLVPHIWAWWVFPAWAIGLGVGMAWPERSAGDAA
ncbi:hypothetical protein [Erythrobacter alti]|uniref:hypothetical protein n=1 Tax=Erythrobacter alti TaxID=1896145 RepID=UPI0030F4707D